MFFDFLPPQSEVNPQVQEEFRRIEGMSAGETRDFISNHSYLLRNPIILGYNKLVVG